MPSNANPKRKDITVHIGDMKEKLIKACNEDGRTPTDVVKEIISKWLRARDRQRQRDAKEAQFLAVIMEDETVRKENMK